MRHFRPNHAIVPLRGRLHRGRQRGLRRQHPQQLSLDAAAGLPAARQFLPQGRELGPLPPGRGPVCVSPGIL
jgi:hypothetical protein